MKENVTRYYDRHCLSVKLEVIAPQNDDGFYSRMLTIDGVEHDLTKTQIDVLQSLLEEYQEAK